jgi:RNA polymerase sigma factor (sigma-70 family)
MASDDDPEPWREIHRLARRYASSRCHRHHVPQDWAEDLAQEACLAAWLRPGDLPPPPVLRSFLFHVIQNDMRAALRTLDRERRAREAYVDALSDRALLDALRLSLEPPEIEARLKTLTRTQADVALLVLEGLSAEEISDFLGITKGAVLKRVRNAIRRLSSS